MDDPLDTDEHSCDVFDDSCIVVGAINIFGMDGLGDVMAREVVSSDESPIKVID